MRCSHYPALAATDGTQLVLSLYWAYIADKRVRTHDKRSWPVFWVYLGTTFPTYGLLAPLEVGSGAGFPHDSGKLDWIQYDFLCVDLSYEGYHLNGLPKSTTC